MKQAYTPIAEVTDDMPIDTGNGIIRFGDIGKQNVAGLPYLNAQIDEVFSKLDSVITLAQEFMKDTSIPLEDRWDVYLKVEKALPIDSYCGRAIQVLTDSLYDEVFPSGRGIRWNSEIDENLVSDYIYWGETPVDQDDEWDTEARSQTLEKYAKRDKWREAVLQEQKGLIVFDW